MNRTENKTAEQSRQKMVRALLKIMEVYDYREITVTQIVQEAGLSRNTYYRLFHNKEEILDLLFEDLFRQFSDRIHTQQISSFWQLMQSYFDFWQSRKPLLLLLQKNHLLQKVLDHSYDRAQEVFCFVHSRDTLDPSALPLPYLLAFSVGGMHTMLIRWVQSGMEIPSSQLIRQLHTCMMTGSFTHDPL